MTNEINKPDAATDAGLAVFFEAVKEHAASPSDALMAAVLADAYRRQPLPRQPAPAQRHPLAWLGGVWRGLGGWQAATALVLFLALGGWLGYTPPSALEPVADRFSGQLETSSAVGDYFPLDDLMNEG